MTDSTLVRIVAAIVDTRKLTLYKEDGSTLELDQGDPRIRPILDKAAPILAQGGIAEVSLEARNDYQKFEEVSEGKVSFFKVATRKLKSFFGKQQQQQEAELQATAATPVEPTTIGKVPVKVDKVAEAKHAINEILAHAVPASEPSFKHNNEDEEHTVIAVVNNTIIPDVQKIHPHINRAAIQGSTKNVEKFLDRLSKVVEKRRHSAEDLLKFMERGDLPIADDGCIIIYKVLKYAPNNGKETGTYVDCHTARVTQRVGSYVCMDESLVDPNRGNECSSGLHVARRSYIRHFGGDLCVIAKVAPEDVIAVPSYDANKMRVCGYHILFELDGDAFSKLRADKPITDSLNARQLLGKALTGEHVGRLEEVRIRGQLGKDLLITSLMEKKEEKQSLDNNNIQNDAPTAIALSPISEAQDVPVEAKEVLKKVEAAAPALNQEKETSTVPVRQLKAKALYEQMTSAVTTAERVAAAMELRIFKKKSKVSWQTLGLAESVPAEIAKLVD